VNICSIRTPQCCSWQQFKTLPTDLQVKCLQKVQAGEFVV